MNECFAGTSDGFCHFRKRSTKMPGPAPSPSFVFHTYIGSSSQEIHLRPVDRPHLRLFPRSLKDFHPPQLEKNREIDIFILLSWDFF